MFQVTVKQHFDAAHLLRGYGGRCENLHGHRFEVAITLQTERQDSLGLAYDFVELKRHLKAVLEEWDHTCLNDIPPFDVLNPSSENIALAVYQQLQPRLQGTPASLSRVQVWESPDSWVAFIPPGRGEPY